MWHDRTLEVVGSTPIGSTIFFQGVGHGSDPFPPSQDFSLSEFLSECFLSSTHERKVESWVAVGIEPEEHVPKYLVSVGFDLQRLTAQPSKV